MKLRLKQSIQIATFAAVLGLGSASFAALLSFQIDGSVSPNISFNTGTANYTLDTPNGPGTLKIEAFPTIALLPVPDNFGMFFQTSGPTLKSRSNSIRSQAP